MKRTILTTMLAVLVLAPAATAFAQEPSQEPEQSPPAASPPSEGAPSEGEQAQPGAEAQQDDAARRRQQEGTTAGTQGAAPTETSESATGEVSLAADLDAAEREASPAAENEDVDEEDEESKLPWRNTIFIFDQTFNTYGLDPGSQLSYNPTYAWSFSLRPRWYVQESLFLRLRQDMELELTDSDATAYNREPMLADTMFDVIREKLVEWREFKYTLGGRVTLPLSLASQAGEVYFGTGILNSVSRTFEGVLQGVDGKFDLNYSHTWAGSNVAHIGDDGAPMCRVASRPDPQGETMPCQASGATTISDSITWGPTVSLHVLENLTADAFFLMWHRLGRELSTATVYTETGPVVIDDNSETHWRHLTWFGLSVGYDVVKWLNLSFGLSTLTGQLNPSGSRRNPFYNYDSLLDLTATLTIDQLYTDMKSSRDVEREQRRNAQRQNPAQQQQQAAADIGPTRW